LRVRLVARFGLQRLTVLTYYYVSLAVMVRRKRAFLVSAARSLGQLDCAIIYVSAPNGLIGALRSGTERRGERRQMHTIILYSKAGCCLCDRAREYLEELAGERQLELIEIDIRRDPDLFERYRYRIPVVTIDGEERLAGQIEESDVLNLLSPG
jgi:glutaredoxin